MATLVGYCWECHEPAPASDHPGAREDANAGVGLQLLSAGHPGRSDRARSRRFLELDFCGILGLAGDFGIARSAGRAADRSGRRTPGAVDLEFDACRRVGPARFRAFDYALSRSLAAARHRHGIWPLRRGLWRAWPYLRQCRAWRDHRHYLDRGFCLDSRMAAD